MLSSTLREAKGPQDDWSGLKDAKMRHRIQVRLHVRAHRRKAKLLLQSQETLAQPQERCPSQHAAILGHSTTVPEKGRQAVPLNLGCCAAGPTSDQPIQLPGPIFSYICHLATRYETCRRRGIPIDPRSLFPLSRDHLMPVMQFNVMRAMATNMSILGVNEYAVGECQLFWTDMPTFPLPSKMPDTLAPTALQLTVPHQRWIDLLPHPLMRDNAIREADNYDPYDLEEDVIGWVCDDPVAMQKGPCTLLVWADPWRPESYELSPEFLDKWAFLVRGCHEILRATNHWRRKRGEPELRFQEGVISKQSDTISQTR